LPPATFTTALADVAAEAVAATAAEALALGAADATAAAEASADDSDEAVLVAAVVAPVSSLGDPFIRKNTTAALRATTATANTAIRPLPPPRALAMTGSAATTEDATCC